MYLKVVVLHVWNKYLHLAAFYKLLNENYQLSALHFLPVSESMNMYVKPALATSSERTNWRC